RASCRRAGLLEKGENLMNRRARFLYVSRLFARGLLLAGILGFGPALADEAGSLSVERLVSLPTLSGTPPGDPAWSPDSRYVAFLWNDSGYLFRDLWVVDIEDSTPNRLTELDPSAAQYKPFGEHIGKDTSLAALREASARRHRGGLSQFTWQPDGEKIVFAWDNAIRIISPHGGTPEVLVETGGAASRLAYSPDGRYLSF